MGEISGWGGEGRNEEVLMKILHVIESLHPSGGGPPMVVASLALAQSGLGHEVTILSREAVGKADGKVTVLDGRSGQERVKRK